MEYGNEPTPIGGVGVPKCLACEHYFVKEVDYPCRECSLLYLKKEIKEWE